MCILWVCKYVMSVYVLKYMDIWVFIYYKRDENAMLTKFEFIQHYGSYCIAVY